MHNYENSTSKNGNNKRSFSITGKGNQQKPKMVLQRNRKNSVFSI